MAMAPLRCAVHRDDLGEFSRRILSANSLGEFSRRTGGWSRAIRRSRFAALSASACQIRQVWATCLIRQVGRLARTLRSAAADPHRLSAASYI